MQTIASIVDLKYYLDKNPVKYYLGSNWEPRIYGSAALHLGISHCRSEKDLLNLSEGRTPDGDRSYVQVQNYNNIHKGCGKVRQKAIGWDLTFSVPKSLSVAWLLGTPEERKQIEEIVLDSVKKSIEHIEGNAAFTRRGKGGKRWEKVKLVVAAFMHPTSRAGDPQLHVHAVVYNIGLRQDKTTGTIVSKQLYNYQKTSGAYFRKVLADQLQEKLPLQIIRAENSFEVAGISKNACSLFSKRAKEIKKILAEMEQYTAKDAAKVTLQTRKSKGEEKKIEECIQQWRQELRKAGYDLDHFWQKLEKNNEIQPKPRFEPVISQAKEALSINQDTFKEKELLEQTLNASIGTGLEVEFVTKATKKRLENRREFVRIPELVRNTISRLPEAVYMLRDLVDDVDSISRKIKNLRQDRSFVINNGIIEKLISYYSKKRTPIVEELKHHGSQIISASRNEKTQPVDSDRIKNQAKITLDPRSAVALRCLTQQSGRVLVVDDWHTPQRDLVLKAAAQAWTRSGYSVIGCTKRVKDACSLEANTNIPMMTVKRFGYKSQPSLPFQLRWHAKGLLRTAMGLPTSKLAPPPLDQSKILVVDKANHLRVEEIKMIVNESHKHGAKVIFLKTPSHVNDFSANYASTNLLNHHAIQTWRHHERTWPKNINRQTPRNEQEQSLQQEM